MNVIENISLACIIGCTIYTSLRVYNNINMKKASAVEPYNEYKGELLTNTNDYYDTVVNYYNILNEILLRYLEKSFYNMINTTLFSDIRKYG